MMEFFAPVGAGQADFGAPQPSGTLPLPAVPHPLPWVGVDPETTKVRLSDFRDDEGEAFGFPRRRR
jgi:hypothetical protein